MFTALLMKNSNEEWSENVDSLSGMSIAAVTSKEDTFLFTFECIKKILKSLYKSIIPLCNGRLVLSMMERDPSYSCTFTSSLACNTVVKTRGKLQKHITGIFIVIKGV